MESNIETRKYELLRIIKRAEKGSFESNLAFEELYNLFGVTMKKFQKTYRIFFGEETEVYVLEAFYYAVCEFKETYNFEFSKFLIYHINRNLERMVKKEFSKQYSGKEILNLLKIGRENVKTEQSLLDESFVLPRLKNGIELDRKIKVRTVENDVKYIPLVDLSYKKRKYTQKENDLIEVSYLLIDKLKDTQKHVFLGCLEGEKLKDVGKEIPISTANSSFHKVKAERIFKILISIAKRLLFISENVDEFDKLNKLSDLSNEEIATISYKIWKSHKNWLMIKSKENTLNEILDEMDEFINLLKNGNYDYEKTAKLGEKILFRIIEDAGELFSKKTLE